MRKRAKASFVRRLGCSQIPPGRDRIPQNMTMTNAALLARAENGAVSDHEPAPKPVRRQFSAAYKTSILEQYEKLTDPGEKGALLRREGLYSSHIVDWRRARDAGALGATPRTEHEEGQGAGRDRAAEEKERAARGSAAQAPAGLGDPGKRGSALAPPTPTSCVSPPRDSRAELRPR